MSFETVEGLITINATLVLQIFHFVVLMLILNRILFKPILKMIDERQIFIKNKREELKKIKEEVERLKVQFVKMESEAKRKAAYERAELREEGIKKAEELLEKSREEVSIMKKEAEKKVKEEMEKTKPILAKNAKVIADEIIKKIVEGESVICILIFALFFLLPVDSFGAESPSKARIIYNNIMLFVNFGIIVFLFIRYGKKPLLVFLNNEREKIKKNILKLEEEYNATKAVMDDQQKKLENIEIYVENIRKSILEMANREKQKIIEDAQYTAKKMIEDANLYYEQELSKAKKKLAEELLDMAISLVKERLKEGISDEINDKIIIRFVRDIENKQEIRK